MHKNIIKKLKIHQKKVLKIIKIYDLLKVLCLNKKWIDLIVLNTTLKKVLEYIVIQLY